MCKVVIIITLTLGLSIVGWAYQDKPLIPPGSTTVEATEQITEAEAVRLAEEFIIINGYTDAPPSKDRSQITAELLDKLATFETIMKMRRNTLERPAYGLIHKRRNGHPGWTIIFHRSPAKEFDLTKGRGVSMDLAGKHLLMETYEYPLDRIEKKFKEEPKP